MLKLNIDVAGIAKQFREIAHEVEQDLNLGVKKLAAATHAKILEDSQQELHTSREKYAKALNRIQEIAPNVYVIALDESALWIEEGIPNNHDMKPALLKNAKSYPGGKRYRVIPFEHAKPPSQMTGIAQKIASQLGKELKKRGVPFKSIEKDAWGRPLQSSRPIHKFDFDSAIPGKGNTPALKNVEIYQGMVNGNVRRRVTTFRTVTDGPESAGKWHHPGFKARHFFERAHNWAGHEWDAEMLPEILRKWKT
jgi:hypothetical protein